MYKMQRVHLLMSYISDILSGATSFAEDILTPINWAGDQSPAKLKGEIVLNSLSFKEAYSRFVESGWQGYLTTNLPRAKGDLSAIQTSLSKLFSFPLEQMNTYN